MVFVKVVKIMEWLPFIFASSFIGFVNFSHRLSKLQLTKLLPIPKKGFRDKLTHLLVFTDENRTIGTSGNTAWLGKLHATHKFMKTYDLLPLHSELLFATREFKRVRQIIKYLQI